jgi:hypothetical protein
VTRRHQLLVAGALAVIAAAVYLAIAVAPRGSRAGDAPAAIASTPPAAAPTPPAPRASTLAAREAPALTPPAPPARVPAGTVVNDPASPASVSEQHAVGEWIDARKNEWTTACWPAPAPDRAAPEPTSVQLRAVFEADGRLRTHAFVAQGHPDVSRCLNDRRFDPPFAGRGQRVDLALTFQFP